MNVYAKAQALETQGGTGLVEGTVAFVKCVMDTEDDSQNARSLDCIEMEACSEANWLNR